MNEPNLKCLTCNSEMMDCVGHFGFIRLALPLYHVGYFNEIINILQCICKVHSFTRPASAAVSPSSSAAPRNPAATCARSHTESRSRAHTRPQIDTVVPLASLTPACCLRGAPPP